MEQAKKQINVEDVLTEQAQCEDIYDTQNSNRPLNLATVIETNSNNEALVTERHSNQATIAVITSPKDSKNTKPSKVPHQIEIND